MHRAKSAIGSVSRMTGANAQAWIASNKVSRRISDILVGIIVAVEWLTISETLILNLKVTGEIPSATLYIVVVKDMGNFISIFEKSRHPTRNDEVD